MIRREQRDTAVHRRRSTGTAGAAGSRATTRRAGGHRTGRAFTRRARIAFVAVGCLVVAFAAAAWVVPRVSDAASQWLDEEPVRGRTVDVDSLEPGSAPPGVEPPSADGATEGDDSAEDRTAKDDGVEDGKAGKGDVESADQAADDEAGGDGSSADEAAGDEGAAPAPDDEATDDTGEQAEPTDEPSEEQTGSGDDAGAEGPDLWPETAIVDGGMTFNLLGAVGRFEQTAGSEHAEVQLRTSTDGETWSDWMTMELAQTPAEAGEARGWDLVAEPLWIGEARYVEFKTEGPIADLKFNFINSLGDATLADRLEGAFKTAVAAIASIGTTPVAAGIARKPAIVTRAQWGANEAWRRADPSYADVKMAIVHHTVTGNDYSRSEAAAVVRAIYYYHARSAGFNDIGYNFLIDRYGVIYEGRYGGMSKGVIGAQTLGFNTGSTGVSVIGDFSNATPPTAALASLKKLLAWKLDVHHVDPTSGASMYCSTSDKFAAGQWVTLPAISGHRDANYSSCPGARLYAQLGNVRRAVDTMGRPKIYSPTISNTVFSPNGDGHEDTTSFRFSFNEVCDWEMKITDSGGTVVKDYSGHAIRAGRTWDGTGTTGQTSRTGQETTEAAGDELASGECRTEALRNFRIDRGGSALFRYVVHYEPPEGESDDSVTARVVLKIRGPAEKSRGTMIIEDVPVNTVQRYRTRLNLRPGYYTYYALARLPDGTRQKSAERGRIVIRRSDGSMPAASPSDAWLAVGQTGSSSGEVRDVTGATGRVPDGTYTVTLRASSSRGTARKAVMTATVDTAEPEIVAFSRTNARPGRKSDGSRQGCRIAFSANKRVRSRVTIRWPDGSWARTVGGWSWRSAGSSRSLVWDGRVRVAGHYVPAPDGQFQVRVDVRDAGGSHARRTKAIFCESDPEKWGDGSTLVTKAKRNFAIRRRRNARFRFIAIYAQPAGQQAQYSEARLVLKIRDSRNRSRRTRVIRNAPLNKISYYTIRRCRLPRGTYRWYILAKLPNGMRQQQISSGRLIIR